MARRHVRKGDEVVVTSGKYKGQKGRILEVLTDKDRVRVEGLVVNKRHLKPNQDPKRPEGGIFEQFGTLHISNVSPLDPSTGNATRVGYKVLEDGTKVRVARGSGEQLAAPQ